MYFLAEVCNGIGNNVYTCCSSSNQCDVNQGDCDSDNDCRDDLVCGNNNCESPFPLSTDCCEEPRNFSNILICNNRMPFFIITPFGILLAHNSHFYQFNLAKDGTMRSLKLLKTNRKLVGSLLYLALA